MATVPVEIDRERLWQKISIGEGPVVVGALSPISYAASHLPGAINIPPQSVEELAERRRPPETP